FRYPRHAEVAPAEVTERRIKSTALSRLLTLSLSDPIRTGCMHYPLASLNNIRELWSVRCPSLWPESSQYRPWFCRCRAISPRLPGNARRTSAWDRQSLIVNPKRKGRESVSQVRG